jgi:hypothetical protein
MTEPTNVTIEQDRPHVSSLIWESILAKPFEVRTTIKNPKQRGRPRKDQLPVQEVGVISNILSDKDRKAVVCDKATLFKIELDFKEYIEEGMSPKTALETLVNLYNLPYAYLFNALSDSY